MTTVIAALRSLVKSLWPFARPPASPASHASPNTTHPMSETLRAIPDNGVSDPALPQAGDTPPEASGERDGPSSDQPEGGLPDDDSRPTRSSTASAETPSDPDPSGHEPALSGFDADDRLPPASAEVETDEPPTDASPTTDDAKHADPETVEDPEIGGPDGSAEGNTDAAISQNSESGPRQFGGRRGRQPGNPERGRQRSPSSRPELVCRRIPASACWEVILTADEEAQVAAAHLEGAALDLTNGRCNVPSLTGRLIVSSQDGQEHMLPLFEGEPLIFKLPKNWAGEGRRTSGITSGHFIVIAPNDWQRMGHAPVEADGCTDPAFRAHYFHRDATVSDETVGGFCEWTGSPVATEIELTGRNIYDDSDHGMLFVGDPPDLKPLPGIEWARVGEEIEQGWGQNFQPGLQSLPEVLGGREGRFFLRVYDPEMRMLDSVAFRYVRDLSRINVNGTEYTQGTVLMPGETGYPRTEVSLVGADGSTRTPVLPPRAQQAIAPSGAVEVLPLPDADCITCSLGSGARDVTVVLDLPRIWWRLEDDRAEPGAWRDTPLVMTREEFRNHAYADATLSVLSKRQSTVRAGFDDRLEQPYSRTIEDDRIAVPLVHFVDHAQIDRRLYDDASFNVEWAREFVPLIVISADPMPEIVSFAAEPATVVAGEETVLEWTTRNAGDARLTLIPDAGVLEPVGTCAVRPAESTRYTLILAVFGADDIRRTVTVTVVSLPTPGEQPAPRVMSTASGWRTGKGFSSGELEDAGLTVKEAVDRSIPIDRRRRTSHRANVETIRSMLDA
ncbi:MAG: hypothetical protein OXC10_11170 [Rhodospirillaceae bacterium]|nr:hypothetical protein [Rhodospirillaceae bacterium]